jgi:hypothetical protein
LGRFGTGSANVEFYHCSIGWGLPIGGVGGGVIIGVIKEGIKEITVAEWVGGGGSGSILIETLRRANGDLERINILLIHFVWKRANVEKSLWIKE